MSQALLQQARELHRAGQLAQAIEAYRMLTGASPEVAEYWKLQAIAEHQAGDLQSAERSIARSMALLPSDPATQLVGAHIAEDLARPREATARFRRATELKPDWAPAWTGLGLQMLDGGDPASAVECFQRAVELQPASARLWNNLAMARIASDHMEEAESALRRAVAVEPGYALAHYNLARVLDMRGDAAGALQAAGDAAERDPRHAEPRLLMGDIHRRQRQYAEAEKAYADASAANPASAKAANALAELYWETAHADRALEMYERAAARDAGNIRAALGRALVLPPIYRSAEHLEHCRERYRLGLESLLDGVDGLRWPSTSQALNDARWTNFYLAYQGQPDRALQERYGEFARRLLTRIVPGLMEAGPKRRAGGARLRVGFASFYFYNCTAGRYFRSWIEGLDPGRFETFVYYNNPWVADDTRAIAAAAGHFRSVAGRGLGMVAAQIRADDLDVLVYPELGMNPEMFTLASMRLARVQVAGWGHPTTTGLPSIDWYLSSADMEPADPQRHYSERLALLPGLGTRYARPAGADPGGRAHFGLPDEKRLYLLPQSLFKIHPDNDRLLARVLAADPEGMAVLFTAGHDSLIEQYVNRLAPVFEAAGVDVSQRVRFMPYMTHAEYLRVNQLCDVMLDTLRWSGGNTSLDALAMGLPVVTLPGELMRGRQTLGMLQSLEVPELVASDLDDYVDKSVALARDGASRTAISGRIVANLDRLFERPEPVRAFAEFLERVAAP